MSVSSPSRALTAPSFAWPTALFAISVWSVHGIAVWAAWTGRWHPAAVLAVASLCAYASFTVLHEGVHGSVCLKPRWVNLVAMMLAALPLLAPGWAFRFIHLEHHRHTNDPDKDPDYWNGKGPRWMLPLRWAVADLAQWGWYLRYARDRSLAERVQSVIGLSTIATAVVWGVSTGHGWALFWAWILPSRIAVLALAFSFDWLVHRPHTVTAAEDRLRATRVLSVRAPVGLLLLGQHLHLLHHLHPGIPFYRYRAAWNDLREVHAVLNYMNGG
ncbi:MAG TPA: fatty acid desaturase [Myxococcaceae bacterium]|nr:fatty acid desaturase [Myxococcaceae bacterium]